MRPDSSKGGQWAFATAIAGAALAVGAVHTISLCLVTAVLAIAMLLTWWNAPPMKGRPPAALLVCTGVGLTVYTALQCVPMPIRWLAAVAPHNADVWARALTPLHEAGPNWAPITLDPGATRVEVLKGVAYLLAFVTALRIARQREGLRFVSGVVVATGILLAVAAVFHPLFGAHRLFGIYEPSTPIERHVAPLINPNNLAGYLNIAICLALAASLAPEPYLPRAIPAAIAMLLGATQVWVASRGGVVAMVLGALVVITIDRLARARPNRAVATLSFVIGVTGLAGAILIVLGTSEEASTELLDADVSKLRIFAHVMRMLPTVPIFGCGRGAFESAFAAFRSEPGYVSWAYPENVVAQWILEWGLPAGLSGLAAVAFALRPAAVLARSTTASGAWAALVAVTAQNVGDLGSEVPGLVLAGVVCAAIVVAGTPGHQPRWRVEKWSQVPRGVAICGAACAAVGIGLAASVIHVELQDDERSLYDAAFKARVPFPTMQAAERAAMLRHPAEPYLPYVAGARAWERHDANPLPWIAAALERGSVYGPAHLVLARTLARRSPSQARLEYRLAVEQMPAAAAMVVSEAPAIVGGYYDAMELVPDGKTGNAVLDGIIEAVKDRLPSTRVLLDAELAMRSPALPSPAARVARDAVEDLEDAPWCLGEARVECARKAMNKASIAQRLDPNQCVGYALRARARAADGDRATALTELGRAVDVVRDRVVCLQELVRLAQRAGADDVATQAIDRIANAGCSEDSGCAWNLMWAAQQEEERGNRRKALALYRRALERTPDNDALLEKVARLAAEMALHVEAAEDFERLARRQPKDLRWRSAAAEERARALRTAAGL